MYMMAAGKMGIEATFVKTVSNLQKEGFWKSSQSWWRQGDYVRARFVCMVVDLGWRMAHVELFATVGNTYRYGMTIVLSSGASCLIMFARVKRASTAICFSPVG